MEVVNFILKEGKQEYKKDLVAVQSEAQQKGNFAQKAKCYYYIIIPEQLIKGLPLHPLVLISGFRI